MRGGLCDEMGYGIGDLAVIFRLMVSCGGLRDTDVKSGETVIVSPATGGFDGAALFVALAMGARVIAMGEIWRRFRASRRGVGGSKPCRLPVMCCKIRRR